MTATDTGANVAVGAGGTIVASHVERFVVYGSDNADTFVGSSGNDFLDGRGGVDTYQGSNGNDAYTFDNSNEYVAGSGRRHRLIWTAPRSTSTAARASRTCALQDRQYRRDRQRLNTDHRFDGQQRHRRRGGKRPALGPRAAPTPSLQPFRRVEPRPDFRLRQQRLHQVNKSVLHQPDGGSTAICRNGFRGGHGGEMPTMGQVIYDKATGFFLRRGRHRRWCGRRNIAYVGKNLDFSKRPTFSSAERLDLDNWDGRWRCARAARFRRLQHSGRSDMTL